MDTVFLSSGSSKTSNANRLVIILTKKNKFKKVS